MLWNSSLSSSPSTSTLSPDKSSSTSSDCLSPVFVATNLCQRLRAGENALTGGQTMPAILENGRKVFGPPSGYVGARPSHLCELYLTHVPRDLDDLGLLCWLQRCGTVYELRLMMDSCRTTRGYAFVRFTREEEALAAYELLNFLFISGERLRVYRSQGKNRLFVSNIPKALSVSALELGFRKAFPEMRDFTAYAMPHASGGRRGETSFDFCELNRGYAFVEFSDHETALEVKKRTTPGRVRMWGCDLKVQWAKPRPVGEQTSQNRIRHGGPAPLQNDYCAKLRLYCLANDWCVPTVVYGTSLRQYGIQYGGILLRKPQNGEACCILLELLVENGIFDVHVLMCEVVVQFLESQAGFPNKHYVMRVPHGGCAQLVHSFSNTDMPSSIIFTSTHFCCPSALHQLACALQVLACHSSEFVLNAYQRSFWHADADIPMLRLNDISFYSIFPKFRNNPPLSHNFNDTEMTLLLDTTQIEPSIGCYSEVGWNCTKLLHLKSQRCGRMPPKYVLRYVDMAAVHERSFYHPLQRFNATPIFIPMTSFQKSIFK